MVEIEAIKNCDEVIGEISLLAALQKHLDEELKVFRKDGQELSTNKGVCYTVSQLGARILQGLGYQCDVRRVVVLTGNETGKRIFKQQMETGKFDRQEMIDAGGWTQGIGVPPGMHYIIYFPKEDEVMDLTFGQADRPEWNLHAEAYWKNYKDLPETIIGIEVVPDNIPGETRKPEQDSLYNREDFKERFEMIIRRGIDKINKEKENGTK